MYTEGQHRWLACELKKPMNALDVLYIFDIENGWHFDAASND